MGRRRKLRSVESEKLYNANMQDARPIEAHRITKLWRLEDP